MYQNQSYFSFTMCAYLLSIIKALLKPPFILKTALTLQFTKLVISLPCHEREEYDK